MSGTDARRELALRLLAVGLGLLAALAAAEIVLRVAPGPPRQRSTRVEERHTSDWHIPDRRPLPRPGTGGAPLRVVAVGDSFTWGSGVYAEDAWPARLERLLWRWRPGRRISVETVCRPGWGTVLELEALERELDELAPDLILWGYVLNDAEPRGEAADALREPLERRKPAGLARRLSRASALYRWAWERLENTRQRRAFLVYYRGLYGAAPGWQAARQALDRLRDLAAVHRIPVVVVIFPIFDGPLDGRYPYRSLHELVAAEARWRDFGVLDLLAAYRGVDARRLALEPFRDAHPDELAHRLAAEAIRDYLVGERLLR